MMNGSSRGCWTSPTRSGGGLLEVRRRRLAALLLRRRPRRTRLRAAFGMRAALAELGGCDLGRTGRLKMHVGVHSGDFDFFLIGESHRELIVPAGRTRTVAMEGTPRRARSWSARDGAICGAPFGERRRRPAARGPHRRSPPRSRRCRRSRGSVSVPACRAPCARTSRRARRDRAPAGVGRLRPLSAASTRSSELGPRPSRRRSRRSSSPRSGGRRARRHLPRDRHRRRRREGDLRRGRAADRGRGRGAAAPHADRRRERPEPAAAADGRDRGHVFAGEVGAPFRRTYTILGRPLRSPRG